MSVTCYTLATLETYSSDKEIRSSILLHQQTIQTNLLFSLRNLQDNPIIDFVILNFKYIWHHRPIYILIQKVLCKTK